MAIIDMQMDRYLEREYLTNFKHSHIVLLRPAMAFMLMQTADPRTIKVLQPDQPRRRRC